MKYTHNYSREKYAVNESDCTVYPVLGRKIKLTVFVPTGLWPILYYRFTNTLKHIMVVYGNKIIMSTSAISGEQGASLARSLAR
jgi:hypothetical protein